MSIRPFNKSVVVKLTNAGPRLLVCGMEVRRWNGVMYNHEAQLMAKQLRQKIDARLVALGMAPPLEDPSKESWGYSRTPNIPNST